MQTHPLKAGTACENLGTGQMSGISQATTFAALVLLVLSACTMQKPVLLDDVRFGDSGSEALHGISEANSVVQTGGLGRACRRIAPNGHLTFELTCDPNGRNYLNLKLWGSDTGDGQLYLYDGERRIGGYQRPYPEIDLLKADPYFPGRFYFSTCMIPKEMTQGRTSVLLRIGSTGQPTPYSSTRKEADQKDLSRGIYSAGSSIDPFVPALPEREQGTAPAPAEAPRPDPQAVVEHLHEQLELAVDRMLTWQYYGPEWEAWVAEGKAPKVLTGAIVIHGTKDPKWSVQQWKDSTVSRGGTHVRCQMAPEVFALAFRSAWSKHHKSAELLDRVVKALDFYRLAQGSDGGFWEVEASRSKCWIGAPDRKPGRGCLMGFGMMGPPAAFLMLKDEIAGTGLLEDAVDDDDNANTPEVPRRKAYADLFEGARDYLTSPQGRGHAPNQDMADIVAAWLCNSCLALLDEERCWDQETEKGLLYSACGFEEDIYGGRWISRKGISMEPNGSSNGGYCGNYGAHVIEPLFRLARLTGDERIRNRALQAAHALSKFRYPSLDMNMKPCIRIEGVITWRNNFTPGRICYGGNPYAATALRDPISLRELQLAVAHGHYNSVNLDRYWVHLQASTVGLFRTVDYLEQALKLPPAKCRLPFETGEPDFAWADEEAGAVVVKDGAARLLMSLNWRHGYSARERRPENAVVNNIARVHYRTPSHAQIANVAMESPHGFGELYVCRYGPYTVAMNCSQEHEYLLDMLADVGPAVDLVTGRAVSDAARATVQPATTLVLRSPN